jgi:Flp pilus assembly protein TadG
MGGWMMAPLMERLSRLRARVRSVRRDQRGTAMVEFALIALPLFTLLFGVIDFGRALNYYNQQTQLVGLGARSAAVDRLPDDSGSATGTSIQQQLVQQFSTGELRNKTQVCISLPNGNAVGDPVMVTATYPFTLLPMFGGTLTLKASQSERLEVAPTFSTGCYP